MQPGKLPAPFHASIVHVVALSLNASTMPSIHSPLFIVALFVVFSWFRCYSLLKSMRLNVADVRFALQSREGRDHEKKKFNAFFTASSKPFPRRDRCPLSRK